MKMRIILALGVAVLVSSCLTPPPQVNALDPKIVGELDQARARKPESRPSAIEEALLPPLRMEMPNVAGQPIEPRFDLSVNNAPAQQVFLSLVNGTRYSMLVHPNVSGVISLTLKDVTLRESLESIRDLYGYEFRVDGSRISIQPAGLQTRVFRVNYLTGMRRGTSEVRVQSGSVADVSPSQAGVPGGVPQQATGALGPGQLPVARSIDSSRVQTTQTNDFWTELRTSLQSIIGAGSGRSVVVTAHSGVVVVRAMPDELRAVDQYLRETRLSVERQVMLEAKIIEVTLSDSFQTGINWAAFYSNSAGGGAIGQVSAGRAATSLAARGGISADGLAVDPSGRALAAASTLALSANNPASSVFGLALQTPNFAAMIQFLETQGSVQVLSSPRVATINNQKAVLKVGTDEFFVTNVATVTSNTVTTSQQTPTVTTAPFFSGILLDVTPRIDHENRIMLHIHPSVSSVVESRKEVALGGNIPSIVLPLPRSTVSETDTIVRVTDGNIVAIGGLMSVESIDNRGGIPGLNIDLLRTTDRRIVKKELVILLKPTVIGSDADSEQDLRESQERMRSLYPREERR